MMLAPEFVSCITIFLFQRDLCHGMTKILLE